MPALLDTYLLSVVLFSANRCRLGLLYVMHTSRGIIADTVLRKGSIFATVLNVDDSGHSINVDDSGHSINVDDSGHSTRESGETRFATGDREPTDSQETASSAQSEISCITRNEHLAPNRKRDAILQDISSSSQDGLHRVTERVTDQDTLSSASIPHPLVSAFRAVNTFGEFCDTHQTASLAHPTSEPPLRLKDLAWRSIDENASPLPWPLEIIPIKTDMDLSKLLQAGYRALPSYSTPLIGNKGKIEILSDVDPVDRLHRLTIMFNKTSSASDNGTYEKGKVRFSNDVDVHVYRSEKYFKRFKFLCCYRQPPPDEYAHFVMPHSATCDADENQISSATSVEKKPQTSKRAALERM